MRRITVASVLGLLGIVLAIVTYRSISTEMSIWRDLEEVQTV